MWALFLGRVLQSVAGSGAWVIGLALLTDSVPGEQLGKVLGFAMSFVSAGILSGPLIAGTVYELAGYWTAWSIPCTIMVLDIIARLIMIEPRDYRRLSPSPLKPNHSSSAEENGQAGEAVQPEETTPLLPKADTSKDETSGHGFYSIMFSDMRVVTGLTSMLLTSILMSSLNNTLPVHLRDIFGWGTMPTGLMFLCLQLPSILCGGLFGAIRDRYGLRIPTTTGWLLCTPVIFCLGIPGLDTFPWAGKDAAGEHMFVGCILAFGMTSLLVRGAGPVQLTCNASFHSLDITCRTVCHTNCYAVGVARDMQAKYPHVFGENGGSSRVFSMTEVSYSLGMMLGPLLSGILFETVGFSLMAIVFCMCYHLRQYIIVGLIFFSCDVCHFGNHVIHLVRWSESIQSCIFPVTPFPCVHALRL